MADTLIVEMIQDKETTNKMRFKEPNALPGKNLHKSPIGTLYLPKEPWSKATRVKLTIEDISEEDGTK